MQVHDEGLNYFKTNAAISTLHTCIYLSLDFGTLSLDLVWPDFGTLRTMVEISFFYVVHQGKN